MWLIGIRSGIITILALIVYGLLIQTLQLQSSIWSNLGPVVFAIGIYSGHYYYRYANRGYMSYSEGVQVGLIVVAFTGIVSGLLSYGVAKFVDPNFTRLIRENIKLSLQQNQPNEEKVQALTHLLDAYVTPEFLLVIIPLTTLLVGFIFNLVIAAFTKRTKQ